MAVVAALGDDDASSEAWQHRAAASMQVPTVLRGLGRETTIDLLDHAYVPTMCNAHVELGYSLLELPGHERFERLLRW